MLEVKLVTACRAKRLSQNTNTEKPNQAQGSADCPRSKSGDPPNSRHREKQIRCNGWQLLLAPVPAEPVSKLTCSRRTTLHVASEPSDSSCGPGALRPMSTRKGHAQLRGSRANSIVKCVVLEINTVASHQPRGGRTGHVFASPRRSSSDEDWASWVRESRRG